MAGQESDHSAIRHGARRLGALTRRFGVPLLLALAVPAASGAQAVAGGAVTSRIDHRAKLITFSIRLLLYPHCTGPQLICQITPADVANIKARIARVWDNGPQYLCYRVRVDVQVQVSPTRPPLGPDAPPIDRVAVRIDQSGGGFGRLQHHVRTVENPGSRWSGSDPSDRLVPSNAATSPTTFGWPVPQEIDVLAHEVGHILGLDDTYTTDAHGNPVDIPGAPHDVMNMGMYDGSGVSEETMRRLMGRHGIREADLQCGYRVNYSRPGMTVKGHKCDGPVGTWRLEHRLLVGVQQTMQLRADIGADFRGTWTHGWDVMARVQPTRKTGGQSGTAMFNPGPPPTMTVSGFGTVPLEVLSTCPP